jgi:glycosyltransferase involved in cell wall biosynthesis
LKGVDVFLTALVLMAARGDGCTAVVVGSGEPQDEARYRAMVGDAGLGASVSFRPPMPARDAFALARTLVVPSRAESMPYIVLEAAAAGLPLIATNVGGIPEILTGEWEHLVPPGDADALAAAMQGARGGPEGMRAEAMLRRERMAQRFSLAAMATRIEAIYRGGLERRYSGQSLGAPAEAGSSG